MDSSKAYPRDIHDALIRKPVLNPYYAHFTVTTSRGFKLNRSHIYGIWSGNQGMEKWSTLHTKGILLDFEWLQRQFYEVSETTI